MIGDANPQKVATSVVDDFFNSKNYKVFVIEEFGTFIGFGVLKSNPFEGANGIAEIVWLGINKDQKRKGFGCSIVKYIEQHAKQMGIRKIYVKTSTNNKSAVCFWVMQNYKFEARMLDYSFLNGTRR
jgi:ribosomal protein S18 acetylase RimI-like enzyme